MRRQYASIICLILFLSAGTLTAQDLENDNEHISFSHLDELPGTEIDTMILKKNGKSYDLEDIRFRRESYILSDGTALPQSRISGKDLFVWELQEYAGSTKTVFVFPDYISRNRLENAAYLLMSEIIDRNHGKYIYSFFNDPQDHQNYDILAGLYEAGKIPPLDYGKLCSSFFTGSTGSTPGAVSPNAMTALTSLRLEIIDISEAAVSAGSTGSEKETRDESSGYLEDLDYLAGYNLHLAVGQEARQLIYDFEKSITSSAEKTIKNDSAKIRAVNILQKELARELKYADYLLLAETGSTGSRIPEIIEQIDSICGSTLVRIYSKFRERTGKIYSDIMDTYNRLVREIAAIRQSGTAQPEKSSDRYRLARFYEKITQYGDDSVFFIQADEKSILDFLALSLPYSDINLVVFYSPQFTGIQPDSAGKKISRPPLKDYESAAVTKDFYSRLVIPSKMSDNETEKSILTAAARDNYLLARDTYESRMLPDLSPDSVIVQPYQVSGAGVIYTIQFSPENHENESDAVYVFIPGTNAGARKVFTANMGDDSGVSPEITAILQKFLTISEAVLEF